MKILQINAVYGTGSTGRIVADISDTIKRAGGESFVAYQSTIEPVENAFVMGSSFTRKVDALRARVFGLQAYGSKRATKRLLRWMDEIKPDVVHLHNLHSHYIHLPLLCKYLAKKDIPTVITLHDCWFFTGKCTHYTSAKCNKWQTGCGNCPQLKKDIPSWLFDRTAKMWKDKKELFSAIPRLAVVGVSDWILNEFKKTGWKTRKTEVIYNGVDTNVFTPHINDFRKRNAVKDEFLILGMANKWGLEENRKAVEELIASQSANVKMIILGCNDIQKKYFARFSNVLPFGYIRDRQELSDIYAACNVFVNLTHADTLPTVNMESICCGTPVIAYNCCGGPELIDSDSGYVVSENDVEQIIDCLRKEKQNPLTYDVKEKHAKFDKNICYQKYLSIYKELCAK